MIGTTSCGPEILAISSSTLSVSILKLGPSLIKYPMLSRNDLYLASTAGIFQTGLPFILLVLASKYISSAVIGLTMLLEAVLGPIWAYLFIKDIPTLNVFIGGIFILIGVILRLYFTIYKNKMSMGFR